MFDFVGQNPWTCYFGGIGLTIAIGLLVWFFDESVDLDKTKEEDITAGLICLAIWPLTLILVAVVGVMYGFSEIRLKRFARIKRRREEAAKTEEQLKAEMDAFIEREQKQDAT